VACFSTLVAAVEKHSVKEMLDPSKHNIWFLTHNFWDCGTYMQKLFSESNG
jgi:hypothetical protein